MMREARESIDDTYDLSEEGQEEEAEWECVVNDAQLSEIRDAMTKELHVSVAKMERDLREKLSKQNGALIALLQNRILALEHDVLKLKMAAVDCSCARHKRYTQDTKDKRQQRVSDDIPLSLFVSRYRMHREMRKAAEQRQIARSTSSEFVAHLMESAIAKVHQDHRVKRKAAQVLHLFVTQRRKFAMVIQELKEHLVHATLTRRVHRVKKINAVSRWREFITDKEIKLDSVISRLQAVYPSTEDDPNSDPVHKPESSIDTDIQLKLGYLVLEEEEDMFIELRCQLNRKVNRKHSRVKDDWRS
eukprot:GILK01016547.1.p1 GENE.GILK01016547.1~~GILK01016547.1.p1  ORF type:complete len:303 (-),score=63.35 GILK01016547.1:371-1279(-)